MISRRRFLMFAGAGVAAVAFDPGMLTNPALVDVAAADAAAPGRGVFGGTTTLDQTTVKGAPGVGGYMKITAAAGEPHRLRSDNLASYAYPFLSLFAFAQMSDLHVVDDQSPLRTEWLDRLSDLPNPQGYGFDSAYRPHEMLSTHLSDAGARALRNVGRAPMTGLPLALTVVTGDMTDNAQLNETRWCIDLLDGGQQIVADSGSLGKIESVSNLLSANGVHDPAYWYPQSTENADGLTDNYQANYGFPFVNPMLGAAREPYTSTGLNMPWYSVFGNHDAEVQGNLPVDPSGLAACVLPNFNDIAVGSIKPVGSTFTPPVNPGASDINKLVGDAITVQVTADPARRLLDKDGFIHEHFTTAGTPVGHGFAQNGSASYYAIPPTQGSPVLFLVLDTSNENGDSGGKIDDEQWIWLNQQLVANSTHFYNDDLLAVGNGSATDNLIVVCSHHTLDTIDNHQGDPAGGLSGFLEGPFHYGPELKSLLLRFPNVILMVDGHTHRNAITPHPRSDLIPGSTGGFWEVNTASHIDWPPQSRIFEISAGVNHDGGVLSIQTTMLDIDAPADYGGDLSSPRALAGLARELEANDPTERPHPRTGDLFDRNCQLLVPTPFSIPLPTRFGSSIALAANTDGRLQLFGTDDSDVLYQRIERAAGTDTWNGWTTFTTQVRSVAAVNCGGNDNRIMVVGTDSSGIVEVSTQFQPGGTDADPWTSLGPVNSRSLAVARNADGHMEIFSARSDGDVWHIWQQTPGGSFGGFDNWSTGFGLSGMLFVNIACATNTDGRVELFAVDSLGALWHRAQILSGGWTDWSQIVDFEDAKFVQLASAVNADGAIQLFVIDHDRRIFASSQTSPGSAEWNAFFLIDADPQPQSRMTQLTAGLNSNGLIELFGVDTASLWRRIQTAPDSTYSFTAWTFLDGNLRPDLPVPPDGSTIAIPPGLVVVPNVVDQSQNDAESTIRTAGLTVGTVSFTANCTNPGDVFSQNPAGGTTVQGGTPIDLTVSICT